MSEPDDADATMDRATREARRGVRGWVRGAGQRTVAGLRVATPYGILAFLTASAVAPVAAPSLGATGEFAAALDQLGGMGSGHLANVLADAAARARGRDLSPEQWRDQVAEALTARLAESDEHARALRSEVGEVLRAVDAVSVALAESRHGTDELRRELARAVAELGAGVAELRWLLDESAQALAELQQELATQGGEQRQQIDLTRRSLVAVTELRQEVLRALPPSGPSDLGEPAAGAEAPPPEAVCPFPGLASFQPEDAEWFSGREALVAQLLGRLAEQASGAGPLVVVGVSGVGKSSLLRAGMLPAVARGALPVPGAREWPWLLMTPGPRPLNELVARTALLADVPALDALREVRASPDGYGALAAQAAMRTAGPDARLLVVVDQLEELFTLGADPAERAAFVTALTTAAPALVVLAVRADFYPHCTRQDELAPALADGQFVVGPLRVEELRRAVSEPAARAGLEVEPGLVELLLADLGADSPSGYEPGALPLLAHALRATWLRRRDQTLTVAGYRESGGIRRALVDTAERIYQDLDAEGRATLRATLLAMVAVAEPGPTVVRRRVGRGELAPGVVDRLVEERLVVADEGMVEVSHEALLDGWPRLAEWVEQDRQAIVLRQRLGEAAREWVESGQDESALYRGARLAAAREWAQGRTDLREDERRFLAASVDAAEASLRAERRGVRRLRRLAVGLTAALVATVVAGLAAVTQTSAARQQRAEALSRQYAAESVLAQVPDPRGSMRGALDAWASAPTPEARGALLSAYMLPYAGQLGTEPGGLSVAVSPDGALVAVGHRDGTVRLWDTATLTPVGEPLRGHNNEVQRVEFSPDGTLLATASTDKVDDRLAGVRVWEVAGGRLRHVLPGITPVAWLPDGRLISNAGGDDEAHLGVWNPRTGRELAAISTEDLVFSVAVSPDGAWVAGGSDGGFARVWRVEDGRRVAEVSGHADYHAVDVAFTPADDLATVGAEGRIQLWEMPAGSQLGEPFTTEGSRTVGNLVVTPDGYLLANGSGAEVDWWEVDTGWHGGELMGFRGTTPVALAASADGKLVAATGIDGATTLWRRATYWLPQRYGVSDVAFHPSGSRFAVGDQAGRVRIWDAETRAVSAGLEHDALVSTAAYAPDGTLASVFKDGTVEIRGPEGRRRGEFTLPDGQRGGEAVFSPDGRLLAVANTLSIAESVGGDSTYRIYVWDVETLQLRASLDLGEKTVFSVAFSPDGSRLLAAVHEGGSTLHAWRTDDFTELTSIDLGRDAAVDIAFNPDGDTLAVVGQGRRIQLWSLGADGQVHRLGDEFGEHPAPIRQAVFSPDGTVLATVTSADPVIRLWDVATGDLRAVLRGHSIGPNAIAFSPDGGTLVSGSADYFVGVWTVDEGVAVDRICRALVLPGEVPHSLCESADPEPVSG